MHIHSKVQEGDLSIPELAELHRQRGYDFICITDHLDNLTETRYREYSDLCKSLSDERFLCLYGVEGVTRSGPHLMAISPSEFVPLTAIDFRTAVKLVQESGGVAVLAHPTVEEVDETRDIPLDGVEVWNGAKDGWGPNSALLRALGVVQGSGQPRAGFGGPDAHSAAHLFRVETILETERVDVASVSACLRSGKFSLQRGPVKIAAVGAKPTVLHWGLTLSSKAYSTFLRSGKGICLRLGIPVPKKLRQLVERTR